MRALCHFTELHKARHAAPTSHVVRGVLYFVLALAPAPASLAAAKCTMSPSAIA